MLKKLYPSLVILVGGLAVTLPTAVKAQAEFSGLEATLHDYYIKLFVPAGVLLAGVVIIYAGIVYATSQGDPTKTTLAKELITGALIGLAILLSAGYIVTAIVDYK